MNKLFKSLLCLVLLAATLGATDKDKGKKTPTAGGLPPIIDRELIFGNPEIAAAQLSPDGKYVAFLKPWKDTRNVYVKGVDEPFSAARCSPRKPSGRSQASSGPGTANPCCT